MWKTRHFRNRQWSALQFKNSCMGLRVRVLERVDKSEDKRTREREGGRGERGREERGGRRRRRKERRGLTRKISLWRPLVYATLREAFTANAQFLCFS